MDGFSIDFRHVDDTVVLRPAGELDLATAPQLEAALQRVLGTRSAAVVDLSGVTFADCSGLSPLRRAIRDEALHGTCVRMFAAAPRVERVLQLTGLTAGLRASRGRRGASS